MVALEGVAAKLVAKKGLTEHICAAQAAKKRCSGHGWISSGGGGNSGAVAGMPCQPSTVIDPQAKSAGVKRLWMGDRQRGGP